MRRFSVARPGRASRVFFGVNRIRVGGAKGCPLAVLWHAVRAMDTKMPVKRYRRGVGFTTEGEPFMALSGELAAAVAKGLAPGTDKCRGMLLDIRRESGWPRAMLAAALGVSKDTLRRWEDGSRSPNAAAKKLIWMVHALYFEPERIKDLGGFLWWGRVPANENEG